MSTLNQLTIRVEPPGLRQNTRPLLHEIRHALGRLAEEGTSTTIDLQAVPFGPGDEEYLLQALGEGEVKATMDALGPTRVWETAYPGVWVVDHYNEDEQRVALQVEVTELPAILRTQREDIRESAHRMEQDLRDA